MTYQATSVVLWVLLPWFFQWVLTMICVVRLARLRRTLEGEQATNEDLLIERAERIEERNRLADEVRRLRARLASNERAGGMN